MTFNLINAVKYFLKATLRPGEVVEELQLDPNKVVISFWIIFLFSMLYSITVLIYYTIHWLPKFPPWIPINIEEYYLYQTFWTIPWGLATWIMISGIAHLLSITGKKKISEYKFEDALIVCSIGWVLPSFYFTWLPETIIVPFFGVFWPPWVDLLRWMVFPATWQIVLITIGLIKTHNVGWIKGVSIGIVTYITYLVMFMVFMR